MTNEEAIAIFKAWIQKDKELQEKGLVDRLENIELYNMAISALENNYNSAEWIYHEKHYIPVCSKCRLNPFMTYIPDLKQAHKTYKYCPFCGARMTEESEEEE